MFDRIHLQTANAHSDEYVTPVHLAALNPNPRILKTLYECGGDFTIEDNHRWTAIHYAATAEDGDSVAEFALSEEELRIKKEVIKVDKIAAKPETEDKEKSKETEEQDDDYEVNQEPEEEEEGEEEDEEEDDHEMQVEVANVQDILTPKRTGRARKAFALDFDDDFPHKKRKTIVRGEEGTLSEITFSRLLFLTQSTNICIAENGAHREPLPKGCSPTLSLLLSLPASEVGELDVSSVDPAFCALSV